MVTRRRVGARGDWRRQRFWMKNQWLGDRSSDAWHGHHVLGWSEQAPGNVFERARHLTNGREARLRVGGDCTLKPSVECGIDGRAQFASAQRRGVERGCELLPKRTWLDRCGARCAVQVATAEREECHQP